MLGFLRSPKWIFGHALVAVTVAAFIAAGFWQLDRLEQRRERNATVTARSTDAPTDLAALLAEHGEDGDTLAYRRVKVTGSYATEDEVVLTGRARDGAPGMHVLTPLVTDDGRTVIVDRGWVPYEPVPEPPIAAAAPPTDEVTVTGLLQPDQPGAASGPEGAGSGDLDYVTSVDLGLLAAPDLPPVVPAYLLLATQEPATSGALPATVEPAPLDEGPHLSYAVQWFTFTAIVLAGYPILIWRTARDRGKDGAASPDEVPARSAG